MASKKKPIEKRWAKSEQKQQLRKANKSMKRNRSTRPPRRNDWIDMADVEEVDQDVVFERIMPRDEADRRKAVLNNVKVVQQAAAGDNGHEAPTGTQGLVVEVSTGLCRVIVDGSTLLCSIRGSLSAHDTGYNNVVAVGDQVIVGEINGEQGVIEDVLPRRNLLSRPDTFYKHLQNVIVANVDQLLIVAAWLQPNLWPELLDRYLITAARNNLTPIICVNKIDLAESLDEVEVLLQPYRDLGYEVILTSAERGDGLDVLRERLNGKSSVLAGLSGVGKSSLLTAVQPDFNLRVGEVNEEWGQGRHTTTQSNMMPFGDNGYVIDTPGIREFGLFGLHRHELIQFYPDLLALATGCRFADCTHQHEPDCAVRNNITGKNVIRYDNYSKIFGTLPE